MNELQITEKIQAPVLSLNFAELEAQATQIAQTYTSIAITDDTYMAAKNDAKTLSGYVNDIEKKRKAIKKQAEEPIKAFDAECKRIEQILIDAKTAIEGVTVKYDEDRKAERAKKIQDYVDKQLAKANLRPEYIARIVKPSNADNLSATLKSIKEAYDEQIDKLLQEQSSYDSLMVIANTMVNAENEKISQKMTIDMFEGDIARILQTDGLTPADMSEEITGIIRTKANGIAEAEERIRQEAIAAERIAAERQKQEEMMQAAIPIIEEQPVAEEKPVVEEVPEVKVAEVSPFAQPQPSNEVNPFASMQPEIERWSGTIKLTGDSNTLVSVISQIKSCCQAAGVEVEVLSSGKC